MVVLIILNIVLIITVVSLSIYIIHDNKNDIKSVCINCDNDDNGDDDKVEIQHKQNIKEKSERVFEGRFITDEEYQQMKSNKRSDISILLEEVDNEYEHFKELIK